ncbi:hypothetical protein K458DRAFT_389728 [Lentithecium fluviatile CBS 122367]|uniref:Uncharacterized protein n=1 Tax=Lentithecium fluviatile CBS 122367 TaxID=1168545 RepID=A0A6G1J0R0_9PLEO|nr:hypothetical protein K458DRAFT_389728 [Lentithecium fluviatile CBS 122367]
MCRNPLYGPAAQLHSANTADPEIRFKGYWEVIANLSLDLDQRDIVKRIWTVAHPLALTQLDLFGHETDCESLDCYLDGILMDLHHHFAEDAANDPMDDLIRRYIAHSLTHPDDRPSDDFQREPLWNMVTLMSLCPTMQFGSDLPESDSSAP